MDFFIHNFKPTIITNNFLTTQWITSSNETKFINSSYIESLLSPTT